MKVYTFAAYIEGELPVSLGSGNPAVYKNQFAILTTRKIENFKELEEEVPPEEEEFYGEEPRGHFGSSRRSWVHFLLYVADPSMKMEQIGDLLPAFFLDMYRVKLVRLTDFVEKSLIVGSDTHIFGGDPDTVYHALNADQLFRVLGRYMSMLWARLANEDYSLSSDQNPFYKAMKNELQRLDTLNAGSYNTTPVVYLFESNNKEVLAPNIDILVTKLNEKGALCSKNIVFFDIDRLVARYLWDKEKETVLDSEMVRDILSEDFARSLRSNTVVIQYGEHDNKNMFHSGAYRVLKQFLANVNKYIDDIQLIFIVPTNNRQVIDRVKSLVDKTVLTIGSEKIPILQKMSFEAALKRAKKIAESFGAEPDDALKDAIKAAQKDYSQTDLKEVVKKWRDEKNIREHFPAYTTIVEEEAQKKAEVKADGALAKLDALIGLKKTKKQIHDVLDSYYALKKRQEQGLVTAGLTLHLAFLGNPGTGKTEVAHLYAEALAESGLIKEGRILEINGIDNNSSFVDTLKKGVGSVIFIDEAYETLGGSYSLAELVAFMEKHRTDTAVILAGYKAETLATIDRNPGLKSRIAAFIDFENYTPSEKIEIFEHFCRENQYELDSGAKKLMLEEILNLNQKRDEGNARQVRNLFDQVVLSQSVRLKKQYDGKKDTPSQKTLMTITKEDVKAALKLQEEIPGLQQLEDLIGLDHVKQVLNERLLAFESESYKVREGIIQATNRIPMHMVFKGNPGTGKTEVAKIIGNILRDKRIIGRGSFIQINVKDLVHAEALFNEAVGSILFLDEAYELSHMPGAKEIIAELMKEMDKHKNDVIFIMAGYTKDMDELLFSNPGFSSRISFQLEFPDYSGDELVNIFHSLAKREEVILGPSVDSFIRALLDNERRKADFGNGRSAGEILHKVRIKQGVRVGEEIEKGVQHSTSFYKTLTQKDFKAVLEGQNLVLPNQKDVSKSKKNATKELQDLIGLEEVKTLLKRQLNHYVQQKERVSKGFAKKPDNVSMHMAFTGNPGTGKTVVARLVARIMKEEGLLATGSFVEAGRQDLVGKYVGHTAPQVEALFRRAQGGVLFIDEAYSLIDGIGRDSFSQEAIDTLIAQMENHKDDTVVILAGYPKEIGALLDANSGFRSRVPNIVHFCDYSVDELYYILKLSSKKRGYKLAPEVKKVVLDAFKIAKKSKGFGNGRYVRDLLDAAVIEHDSKLEGKKKKSESDYNRLSKEDFVVAVEHVNAQLVEEKRPMGF